METWMKVGQAALLIAMLLFVWPAAKWWMQNGPKGSNAQWLNALLLLGGVMLFVLLLMKLV